MEEEYDQLAARLEGRQAWVCIAGAPGSGKTSLARAVAQRLGCAVVPMDGYHIPKARLTAMDNPEEAIRYRGAPWTFDGEAMLRDLVRLRDEGSFAFPSFDHGTGDPVEQDILVTRESKVVLIEGNYLLLNTEPWISISALCDELWFIDCDEAVARDRVIRRHEATGKSHEYAVFRADDNDVPNGRLIRQQSQEPTLRIQSIEAHV